MVTLRRERMWEFLDRLVDVALPRIARLQRRLAQGVRRQGQLHARSQGADHLPEINYDRIDVIKGLNISFVTTAQTDEEGRALLQHLGMPFRRPER